jgi:hypothetical protein
MLAGVVFIEDSFEDRILGLKRLCCEASSAASPMDTAELFLCEVLKANFGFGSNLARDSWSFSVSPLIA